MSKRLAALAIRVLPYRTPRQLKIPPFGTKHCGLLSSGQFWPTHWPSFEIEKKYYSQDGGQKATVPATISGQGHIWPNPFKMVKNYLITKFILPRIDPDFNLPDFMNGAKKAIEVISHLMSKGDYMAMENFVEPIVVASIKDSLKDLSLRDQAELAVDIPDIMVSFPYSIETLFRVDDEEMQKRIDVLVVCHVLNGWGSSKQNAEVVIQLEDAEVKRKVQFLNYQFTRTYIPSKETSWLVTGVHHFKPDIDVAN